MRYILVSYEEAKELKPIFQRFKKSAQWKDVRSAAGRILKELEDVRDQDYSPLSGFQLMLDDKDADFFEDARRSFEV
jgi:hypothetical protein